MSNSFMKLVQHADLTNYLYLINQYALFKEFLNQQ